MYDSAMDRMVWQQLPNALTVARLLLAAAFFGALNAYRFPDTNVLWGNDRAARVVRCSRRA